jgi:hypothetical protein
LFSKAFASTARCSGRDRILENQINARLAGRGKVAAYTIEEDGKTRYGLTYSSGSKHKSFERAQFELDIDMLIEGLGITAADMDNARLPRGWVYDQEDADANPLDDA